MRGTVHWILTVSMETLIALIIIGCLGGPEGKRRKGGGGGGER